MLNWFDWNGTRCTDYGIQVTELPPITIPSERATFTAIPGRSGSLVTLEGDAVYDDMVLSVTCVLSDSTQIPAICSWLMGSGNVTFANRQGGHYKARVVNQISFDKILRGNPHREFTVNFRCQPFWYVDDVAPFVFTTSGRFINNPGTVFSEPIITVNGTGDISLIIGMTICSLYDVSGSITLDSTLMEAYQGNSVIGMNSHMSGDFPILQPGQNAVSWTGSVSRVDIQPNWRML